ncbi:nuclear transport factor 2 family protein [Shimia sp. SDUM112013]|uniref:nuclear transport factor 2 family protein n=1 Tax=Shimia sp. SDUM112013 TaxID=3136160 RepID=UPI0032EFC3FE
MFRKLFFSTVSATALAIPATAEDISDHADISRLITDIAAGADRHEWSRVRSAFGETVTVDYSSLWGGMPLTQSAEDLVAAWAGFLPGFDITHHMVTNHTITAKEGNTATAEADFTATHRIGTEIWVLGGRYSYGFEKTGADWAITSLTMTALWETGDRSLVTIAGARAAAD